MNAPKILTITEFMALLNIKSQTTFNKRAKQPGFPVAIEWPPNTRKRGWIKAEVDDYISDQIANARRWPDLEARPLAGVVKDQQTGRQSAGHQGNPPTPAS